MAVTTTCGFSVCTKCPPPTVTNLPLVDSVAVRVCTSCHSVSRGQGYGLGLHGGRWRRHLRILTQAEYDDPRFSYRVAFLRKTSNAKTAADKVVKFVPAGSRRGSHLWLAQRPACLPGGGAGSKQNCAA